MTDAQQRNAAKKFAEDWKNKGYEKGQSQPFWLALLRDVYGVESPELFIHFEEQVVLDSTSFIDATIPSTKVMIEQKSLDKDLKKPIRQSDGTLLTPFQQAKRYIVGLPLSKHPRWVVICNFSTFHVYDMEKPGGEPHEILLEKLPEEYVRLFFLVDGGDERLKLEERVSLEAGKIVGFLYNALEKQYIDPTSEGAMKSLNMLCVRLVFCLYAEDAGIFGKRRMFHNYLLETDAKYMRRAVKLLFEVLDSLPVNRDPYLEESLTAFPYVNGGLFDEKDIEIPQFTDEIRQLLLVYASQNFNWSQISPAIFGAVFESTLNPVTRRSGGMHYTSLVNIHKVIDPLFFDGLNKEFEKICQITVEKTKTAELRKFQDKLASLTFLDPACGSGNFLTETYISLRRLENEVLSILHGMQIQLGDEKNNPIKVSISQFYGIEINDFAVTVARTALWIAESQMLRETENIVQLQLDYLPLKSYANIVEGNALRMDWESVIPKGRLTYIMGNPPFVGGMMMTGAQKAEMKKLFGSAKGVGEMDYVCAWYNKAAEYMAGTNIRAAFVSTNSITQGQQAVTLWKPLVEKGLCINFAHRSFKWNGGNGNGNGIARAADKAAVHCVIVGISYEQKEAKRIYDGGIVSEASQINAYLVDAPYVFIEARHAPLSDVPPMRFGSMPRDGGGLVLNERERDELLKTEPLAAKWVRPYIGADEFINGKTRWCLWLVGAEPSELLKCPTVLKRVESVRNFRLNSKAESTRGFAETPTLFCQIAQPETDYIFVPSVSSEKRRYIPIGFMSPETIASNLAFLIPEATLYHFGILTSNVHMAWVRAVCGRLEMRYRYSKDIVYNNFPWPNATDGQKADIEELSRGILDARAKYPGSNLAEMYGDKSILLHTTLLNAHRALDRAVMNLYGFPKKEFNESDCVAALMEMYKKLTHK